MTTAIQKDFERAVKLVINENKDLVKQKPTFKFASGVKLILNVVGKREQFKNIFEETLKKQKVAFQSRQVSGSTFSATIIDFSKFDRSLKNLTIQYKETPEGKARPPSTQQQELGYAYIFNEALAKNVDFEKKVKSVVSKRSDKGIIFTKKKLPDDVLLTVFKDQLPELRKIFNLRGSFPEKHLEWLNAFYWGQNVLLKKYSRRDFTSFNRDGGFMEYITKYINTKFNISQKDTWDPADVWAIKGSQQSIEKFIDDGMVGVQDYKEISKKFQGEKLQSYLRAGMIKLNSLLIDLLTGPNPRVVGISLKLIDSGAKIEEVNFNKVKANVKRNAGLIDTIANPYKVDPKDDFKCNFKIQQGKESFTQDVQVSAEDMKTGTEYVIQIKANDSGNPSGSGLKFELTIKGKSLARAGKVPMYYVKKLLNDYKAGFFNNQHTEYPRTSKEFRENLTKGRNYKAMFNFVGSKGIDLGVKYNEFVNNVVAALDEGKKLRTNAVCKLMGFEILDFMLKLKEKQMATIITDWTFLAQKKNIQKFDTFGPFIKIY